MTIETLAVLTCQRLNLPVDPSGETEYIGYNIIKKALQEQDKITRHACAEAVLALPRHIINEPDQEGLILHWGVDINQASAACINVKPE